MAHDSREIDIRDMRFYFKPGNPQTVRLFMQNVEYKNTGSTIQGNAPVALFKPAIKEAAASDIDFSRNSIGLPGPLILAIYNVAMEVGLGTDEVVFDGSGFLFRERLNNLMK